MLIGHLLGTTLIFTALFTLGWLVSVALHALHRYHPFPSEVFSFITRIELYVLYADAFFCAVALTLATVRFCKKQILEVVR